MTEFMSAADFSRRTCGHKNVCISNKPKARPVCAGVMFSVEQPKIRESLNQQTYRCDKCEAECVVQGEV